MAHATVDLVGVSLYNDVTLTGGFTASRPLMIEGERVTLQWLIEMGVDPGTELEWYLEFTDSDPNGNTTNWFREVDEQDVGDGTVTMAAVVRTFNDTGGGGLPALLAKYSCQFVRQAQFVRIQARVVGGGGDVAVTVTAPFGQPCVS